MAEGIGVLPDGVAEAALVQLHVVDVIQDLQAGRADQAYQLRRRLRVPQKIAGVVCGDVQRFQIEGDACLLRQAGAGGKARVQGAELHRVGEVLPGRQHHAPQPQTVGVDGDAGGAQEPGRLQRAVQKGQIRLPLGRVDQREVRVPVEAADRDPGPI